MSHQRALSTADAKTPHTVSLKVLRLARPSLTEQYPLPASTPSSTSIPISASLAHPSNYSSSDEDAASTPFTITPALSLPSAFGAAYVGETFACTLCANNELPSSAATNLSISSIRIAAEIQTPSHPSGIGLALQGEGEEAVPGGSVQRVLRYELSEEGNHVLAVTVTYTETSGGAIGGGGGAGGNPGGGGVTGGRVRTFRKLYQFVAQQVLNVRTKAGDVEGGEAGKRNFALEAQLENLGVGVLSLESVSLLPNPLFTTFTLSLSTSATTSDTTSDTTSPNPVLHPHDILQVAFLLSPKSTPPVISKEDNTVPELQPGDTRTVLGQLSIKWRGAMGERGSLRTGWLCSRG